MYIYIYVYIYILKIDIMQPSSVHMSTRFMPAYAARSYLQGVGSVFLVSGKGVQPCTRLMPAYPCNGLLLLYDSRA